MRKQAKSVRVIVLTVVIVALFVVYALRLVSLQLVHGQDYVNIANSTVQSNITVEAARGEILDRNGSPLVTNEPGNSLVFTYAYFPKEQQAQNDVILALIRLLETSGVAWIDKMPLILNEQGEPTFPPDRDTDIATMKSKAILDLNSYATAQNCYDALIEKYSLQAYEPAEARKIASVRYEMTRTEFSGSIPYTFAEKVSTDIVSKVKENNTLYQGVDVEVVPYRSYADGTLAPHIIGRTAALDAEEYKELKSKGYRITDKIGKDGIERAAEDYLRGENGVKRVTTDASGNVSETFTKDPQQGDTVILTLDARLQRVAQEALDAQVARLAGKQYASGSAVAIDVRNGDILACATNPRYDISSFAETYTALAADKKSPLWNRPLRSTYAPGSSFKPGMAMAGLEEGVLTKTSTFNCTYHYMRYPRDEFYCLGTHGNIDVVNALKVSCNIFFYETGYYLGIDRIGQYSTMYGFGQKTGVELPEESGSISTPETAEQMARAIGSSVEDAWGEGQVIQTAIGQSYNQMTPLQMANYCAMIATGGTRYTPHFIKSVKSADYSQTVLENQGTIAYQADWNPANVQTVHEGMYAMANYQNGAPLNQGKLKEMGIKVCAKSGTPQVMRPDENGVPTKHNNGFLIAFAPMDDPQIAVCIAIEDAGYSYYTVPVAKAILEAYFTTDSGSLELPQQANQLLG